MTPAAAQKTGLRSASITRKLFPLRQTGRNRTKADLRAFSHPLNRTKPFYTGRSVRIRPLRPLLHVCKDLRVSYLNSKFKTWNSELAADGGSPPSPVAEAFKGVKRRTFGGIRSRKCVLFSLFNPFKDLKNALCRRLNPIVRITATLGSAERRVQTPCSRFAKAVVPVRH